MHVIESNAIGVRQWCIVHYFHFNSHLGQLISNKMASTSVMKVGMGVVYRSIYVSWCLKQHWMCCYGIISSNNNINSYYIKQDSEISSL